MKFVANNHSRNSRNSR